jgi:putative transposase
MSNFYRNKYRIPTARATWWNYSNDGLYFITICTSNRQFFFGEIVQGKMALSEIGINATNYWCEIPNHFSFVKLHSYVVMPNHIHGIIEIIDNEETRLIASLPEKLNINGGITGKNNPMISESLPKIIRWFKGRTTFEIRKTNPDFAWQSRYHDHIIRNENDYYRITEYIEQNPQKWDNDCYFP